MAEPYKPPYVGSITRHWDESNIDNYYEYPAGFAASRFFHELKENGRIVASVCKACGCKTLPPKAFCPRCFKSDVDYVDVGLRGTVYTFTVSYVDLDGSRLEKPIIWALIVFDGVESAFYLWINGKEVGGRVLKVDDGVHEELLTICDLDNQPLEPGDQVDQTALNAVSGLHKLLPEVTKFIAELKHGLMASAS